MLLLYETEDYQIPHNFYQQCSLSHSECLLIASFDAILIVAQVENTVYSTASESDKETLKQDLDECESSLQIDLAIALGQGIAGAIVAGCTGLGPAGLIVGGLGMSISIVRAYDVFYECQDRAIKAFNDKNNELYPYYDSLWLQMFEYNNFISFYEWKSEDIILTKSILNDYLTINNFIH